MPGIISSPRWTLPTLVAWPKTSKARLPGLRCISKCSRGGVAYCHPESGFERGNIRNAIIRRDVIHCLATDGSFQKEIWFLWHTFECSVTGAEVQNCSPVVASIQSQSEITQLKFHHNTCLKSSLKVQDVQVDMAGISFPWFIVVLNVSPPTMNCYRMRSIVALLGENSPI